MKKEHIRTIFECIIVFTMIYIFNTFLYDSYDHLIDFTHCYSIADNLKIYQDFNIVVGPVYPVFISIFLRIFGNNLLVFHIVNSLILVGIYILIKKHNKNTLAISAIGFCYSALGAKYNLLTLLLFYMIYYTELGNHKYKDYIIGILLSILIFTKINIGCALIIPTFVLYFKKPKIILKRFIAFLIPSILIIIIMLLYGVLSGFINYTLLGLISFNQNSAADIYIIFLILIIIYILKNIKKDRYLIYMLCYLIMCYPLFESGHIYIAIFPTLVYILDNLNKKNNNHIINLAFILSISLLVLNIATIKNVFETMDCKNKHCSQQVTFNYKFNKVHTCNDYLKNKRKKYRIFYLNYDSYFFKLDLNEKINKYDFIWNGNMGYKGENTYIKEIRDYCNRHKCMFIINEDNIYKRNKAEQINIKILKFVEKEYKKVENDNYFNGTIYSLYTND